MKKLFKSLAIVAVLGMVAVGCKKKDEVVPTPPTAAQLLTAKPWKTTAFTMAMGAVTVDLFADPELYPACAKDDLTVYKTDAKVEWNAGATKCSPTEPQVEQAGTWALESNNTKLKQTTGAESTTFDVVELTATSMKLKATMVEDGQTLIMNMTFAAQ